MRLVATLFVAGMMLATASSSNAAFVLIDNFFPGGTGSSAVRSLLSPGVTFAPAGQASFSPSGATLSYNTINLLDGTGLADEQNTLIGLSGVTLTGGNATVIGIANDTLLSGKVITPMVNGFVDFGFLNLMPKDFLDKFELQVLPGAFASFTLNGLYAVPEPTSLALLGLASCFGGGMLVRRRRRSQVK